MNKLIEKSFKELFAIFTGGIIFSFTGTIISLAVQGFSPTERIPTIDGSCCSISPLEASWFAILLSIVTSLAFSVVYLVLVRGKENKKYLLFIVSGIYVWLYAVLQYLLEKINTNPDNILVIILMAILAVLLNVFLFRRDILSRGNTAIK